MGILQKADRCMDEAAALFGENKLFLAENKAQEIVIAIIRNFSCFI